VIYKTCSIRIRVLNFTKVRYSYTSSPFT